VVDPEELEARSGWRRYLSLGTIDTRPLRRHRDFRLLYIGRAISFFGTMITMVAIPYQVYLITRSSLAVGAISGLEIVPILALGLFGGALADALDRRLMALLSEIGLSLVAVALVLNVLFPLPTLAILYAAAVVMAALDSLQTPALSAMLPRLVDRDELIPAAALDSLRGTGGMIAGPAIGGILIASVGLANTYMVDVATFVVDIVALALMHPVPAPADAERPSLRRIAEGIRYARSRQELMGTYLIDMNAMFFGMPNALFPALAFRYGGASTLGILLAAPAVGAFIAVATSGWSGHINHPGRAIALSAAMWGLAIIGFGLSPNLPIALVCLAVAGGADMLSGVFRHAIWNQTIPDSLRGRLAGIEMISYSSGPTFGNLEAGAVATAFSLEAAIISGGVLCVLGTVLLAWRLPGFIHYDGHKNPAAASTPGIA
jgi:MFS family permease